MINSFSVSISDQDSQWVLDAVQNGWGTNRSKYINIMEKELCRITSNQYCLGVSHGTDAIQLAITALNLHPGDEVIVPDLTWVACASPIIHSGLIPVFVNVDSTLCMSPESLRNAITPKTKAILVVDLAGSLPKWDEIIQIAKEFNLFVIEDAAESLGASYKNKPAGSFGDISILSFSATKVVTGGHGGAILTNNRKIYDQIRLLFHHGIDQQKTGKYYWSTKLGFNFQLSNIQAALIASQLTRLETLIDYKEELYNLYRTKLIDVPYIELVSPAQNVKSSYWLIVAKLNASIGINKEHIISESSKFGIDIRPFFYLLSDMPPFANYRVERVANRSLTEELSNLGICLPYGYDMSPSKVENVATVLKGILVNK